MASSRHREQPPDREGQDQRQHEPLADRDVGAAVELLAGSHQRERDKRGHRQSPGDPLVELAAAEPQSRQYARQGHDDRPEPDDRWIRRVEQPAGDPGRRAVDA